MTQAALLNCFPKGSMKDERRGSWSGNEMGLQRRWMVEEEEVVKQLAKRDLATHKVIKWI